MDRMGGMIAELLRGTRDLDGSHSLGDLQAFTHWNIAVIQVLMESI